MLVEYRITVVRSSNNIYNIVVLTVRADAAVLPILQDVLANFM